MLIAGDEQVVQEFLLRSGYDAAIRNMGEFFVVVLFLRSDQK